MKIEEPVLERHPSPDEATVASSIDPVMEKRVIAKFDRWFLPQIFILNLIAYLDRSNVGNAKVFGFAEDLHLKGNEFSNLVTLFYVTYVVFETPWAACVKRFGVNKVLAVAFVCWGIVTLGNGFVQNYSQAMACRLLLGAFEAGISPSIAFFISTVYPRKEQAKRMAMIYISAALSGAFGGLIAYGIQKMGEQRGLAAWRWLFIIEGVVTIVVCGCCWFSLPTTAEDAWFLTEEEKSMMQLRKKLEHVYKGDDKFEWRYVRMATVDPMVWLAAVSLFGAGVCLFGFGTFLPSILKGQGYTSLQANYLSIPVYIWATIATTFATWLSDRLGMRAIVAFFVPLPVICGYAIAIGTTNHGAGYFAMYLVGTLYAYNTLLMSWLSNNLKPDYKRAVGLAFYLSFGNISGAIAGQIYVADTAPRYVLGNAVSLGMEAMAMAGIVALYVLWRSRDMKKQQLLDEGVTDNGKEGDRALDFKYIL
ncbi:hypothetical protein A1O3_00188 [Capronia epimyces CBS 606.96]|uniref:Major facilitator superfamily (MFS) profile domain-containing protein n=1 Tax=Capronia epimyces CBS 606.96 TaxID=1182542 RepID=W9YGF7_9EURO|nr:uncharacterized protein A1O3_00188 [Capronia epimyces CBS 606.96]EXJ91638.1 hypothetical protein A1O3_00188 [Capronia epimyces CBS 606.96]